MYTLAPLLRHERDTRRPASITRLSESSELKQIARRAGLKVWEREECPKAYRQFSGGEYPPYSTAVASLPQAEWEQQESYGPARGFWKPPVLLSRSVWLIGSFVEIPDYPLLHVDWNFVILQSEDGYHGEYRPTDIKINTHEVPNEFTSLKEQVADFLGIDSVRLCPSGKIVVISGPVWVRKASGELELDANNYYALDNEIGLTIAPEAGLRSLAAQPLDRVQHMLSVRHSAISA